MQRRKQNNSFIIKDNFQFIVDFCANRQFRNTTLNFKDLSIRDRVFLSTYLTGLVSQKFIKEDNNEKKLKQMCNIIFDFNNKRQNNIKDMNMYKITYNLLQDFLKDKQIYCNYVESQNIIGRNNSNDLFKVSLNSTEYSITRKMKFKDPNHLFGIIYILGTAKNHTTCALLNKFDLHYFSKCLKTATKIIDKLFNLMEWKYIAVNKSIICWKSKWKLDLENNDLTKKDQIDKKITELLSYE